MAMHKLLVYRPGEEDDPFDVFYLPGVCLRDLKAVMGGWVGDPGMGDHIPIHPEHAGYFHDLLGVEMDFEKWDYYVLIDRGGVAGWLDDDFGDTVLA